jgi:endonuclease III
MYRGGPPGRLSALLLDHSNQIGSGSADDHWSWMDRRPITKKDANKFLLEAMIDFHWKTEIAYRRAREFAEVELGDPPDLWQRIVDIPLLEWQSRKGNRSLHSTSQRHLKIRKMAQTLVDVYGGDALRLWADRSPENTLGRLLELGLGPQLSRMTVGALLDEEQVDGAGDVKPDIHLKRVLGRALEGHEFTEVEVIHATRVMRPTDRWPLDWPTWHIGRNWCHKNGPDCAECPIQSVCAYRYDHSDKAV